MYFLQFVVGSCWVHVGCCRHQGKKLLPTNDGLPFSGLSGVRRLLGKTWSDKNYG